MIKYFCDRCSVETVKTDTIAYNVNDKHRNKLGMIIISLNIGDGVNICKNCIIDTINKHDDRLSTK